MSKTFCIGSLALLLLGCSKPQQPETKVSPPITKRDVFRARIAKAQAQFEAQLPNQMPPNNSQNATEEQISMVHTSRYHLPPLTNILLRAPWFHPTNQIELVIITSTNPRLPLHLWSVFTNLTTTNACAFHEQSGQHFFACYTTNTVAGWSNWGSLVNRL